MSAITISDTPRIGRRKGAMSCPPKRVDTCSISHSAASVDTATVISAISQELRNDIIPSLAETLKQDITATLKNNILQELQATMLPVIRSDTPTVPTNISHDTVPSLALRMGQPCLTTREGGICDTPDIHFQSLAIPLDNHIQDDLRLKIVSHKFVDLDTVLPKENFSRTAPESSTFKLIDGVFTLVPSSKAKRVKSIDSWLTAFNIYSTVYQRGHQSSGPKLNQYIQFVRGLATDGLDWNNFAFSGPLSHGTTFAIVVY